MRSCFIPSWPVAGLSVDGERRLELFPDAAQMLERDWVPAANRARGGARRAPAPTAWTSQDSAALLFARTPANQTVAG